MELAGRVFFNELKVMHLVSKGKLWIILLLAISLFISIKKELKESGKNIAPNIHVGTNLK